jgi:hypothetical protein
MSKISLSPDASGTATFTIEAPGTSTNRTLTLPDAAGTIVTTASDPSFATTIGVGGATPSNSGSGITFPATQSASTDANTLDDYEEGTWTPVDGSGASLSLSNNSGTYTKIGQVVFARFNLTYPSTANATAAKIAGLPFTVANDNVARQGFVSFTDETTLVRILPDPNLLTFNFRSNSGGVLINSTLSEDSVFGTLIYPVA